MRRWNRAYGWFGAALLALCGCLGPWRPTAEQVISHEQADVPVTPAACLEAIRAGRWVYERRSLTPGVEEPVADYFRTIGGGRLLEVSAELAEFPHGAFAGEAARSQPAETQPAGEVRERRRRWAGVRIEVDEPLDPFPAELIETGSVATRTAVRCAWPTGPIWGRGTLTRVAEIEGFEDIDCPAGRFEGCLRLRIDLTVRFPLTPIFDWTTYHWLHPRAGEVRRVERLAGWFVLLWFGSAHEYLLKSYELMPHEAVDDTSPVQWSKVLLVLDRTIPHPRIAGLSVEMAASQPAP